MKIGKPDPLWNYFKKGVNSWVNEYGGWIGLDWVDDGIEFNKLTPEKITNPQTAGPFSDVIDNLFYAWFDLKKQSLWPQFNINDNYKTIYQILEKIFDY